ncbi:MAG: MMPL family transporter [Myxococcota bacterium]|nr:MMPL family transporter [Myxococcota bacterium]
MKDRTIRWLALSLLAFLAIYIFFKIETTNSIIHFIPNQDDAELVELSLKLVESPLARRMLISISGGKESSEVASSMREALKSHPEVDWIQSDLDQGALQEIYELYFDRSLYMISPDPSRGIPAIVNRETLEEKAISLRDRLSQPGSMLLARTSPMDPLGLFDSVIERVRLARPQARVDDEGEYAVFMLGLRSTPFDAERQTILLDDIKSEFSRQQTLHGDHLILEQSGVNLFAVSTEQSVRQDGNLISLIVICVVSLLFLLVFHSLRQMAIAILVPLGGFAAAITISVSGSEPVHGITIAFGFVLIGVAIDYAIHVMCHHALSVNRLEPRAVVRYLRPSLMLSAFTTTVAFLALAFSDFPGLSEMGAFAAFGIPVSLFLTLFVVPSFLPREIHPTRTLRAISDGFNRALSRLEGRMQLAAMICAGCSAIALFGISQLRWQDDPAALMAVDPELYAESERVRERIADYDGGRFVVGIADTAEEALILNDEIAGRLAQLIENGELGGVGSLHSFLWSERLQYENLEILQSQDRLHEIIDSVYSGHGFRSGSFAPFQQAVNEPRLPPLLPQDLKGSPLERAADSLVEFDEHWAVVTYLRGVRSAPAIERALIGLDGVHYVDQREIMAGVYAGYRRSTVGAVSLGSLLILIFLQIRYRNLIRGLLAFLPPALAALTTLGIFGLAGMPVSVVSAISLLVVLGMGVDYGIFAVDTAWRRDQLGPILSSLLISCLTSISVFGLLALADQPVLRSIGLTTGLGVLLAFFFTLPALVLAPRKEPSGHEVRS